MQPATSASASVASTRLLSALALLWLTGNALRLTVLAVPPVIPLIHDELQLTATQVGILTGLPSMLLAAAAVPGSLLIAKLGLRGALVVGLVINAVGGALRGAFPNVLWLDARTVAAAAGIAVMQVTMPSAVRAWLPDRIGFATAVYTNGLLIGEVLPASLTLPFVLPLVGGRWEWVFVFWSAPVLAIALAVQIFAPTRQSGASPVRLRWWPDWGDLLIWRLGFMLGTVNAMYFTANAFIPDLLRDHGESEWISAALTGLNAGQLPASFVLLAFARQLELKVWPIVTCGIMGTIASLMIIFGSGPVVVAGATLVGLSCASILILVLALPPLLAKADDLHRVTAAMFTISYSCAVIVPIISGAAWDVSGVSGAAFAPIALSGVLLIVLAPAISHVRRPGAA
jgi:MFS transporter, CP family, cyanate transporter